MNRRSIVRPFLPLTCSLLAVAIMLQPAYAAGRSWVITPVSNPGVTGFNYLLGVTTLSPTLAWAVGAYRPTPNTSRVLIERWNGSTWTQVPGANPGTRNFLVDVAAWTANDVWATGSYLGADNIGHALIEHFNGVSWSAVPAPDVPGQDFNDLVGVAIRSPQDVFAVGLTRNYGGNFTGSVNAPPSPLAEHWNGTSWTRVSTPSTGSNGFGELSTVSISGGTVLAVGDLGDAQGNYRPLVARWNGSGFVQMPLPDTGPASELSGVDLLSPQDGWAVGDYYDAQGNDRTLAEHWNGSTWSIVPSPNVANGSQPAASFFYDLSALASNEIWAVGGYEDSSNVEHPLTEHWDGSAWSIIPSPTARPNDSFLNDVAVVVNQGRAISPSEALAVGSASLDPEDSYWQPLAECYC